MKDAARDVQLRFHRGFAELAWGDFIVATRDRCMVGLRGTVLTLRVVKETPEGGHDAAEVERQGCFKQGTTSSRWSDVDLGTVEPDSPVKHFELEMIEKGWEP